MHLAERLVLLVLFRDDVLTFRPLDTNCGVVPQYAVLIFRRVEVGAFIEEVSAFTHDTEAMSETGWHIQLAVIISTQLYPNPFAEGRRIKPYINRNIEYHPFSDSHQLALWPFQLVMQPAQDTMPGTRLVILDELCIQAQLGIFFCMPCLEEKTALVTEYIRLDQQYLWYGGR